MTISVNWGTDKIINIPQADLTHIGGTLYELDTNAFRLILKDLEDDPNEGMIWPDTHRHNTEVTVAGVTFARTIEIINGYKVQFEDGQYTVLLTGSNNNIFDVQNGVLVQNQVQVVPGNSAGLQVVETGVSGLTASESAALLQLSTDYSSLDDRVGFLEAMARAKKKVARSVSKLLLTDSVSGRSFEADLFKDEDETLPYAGEGIEVQGEITETTP